MAAMRTHASPSGSKPTTVQVPLPADLRVVSTQVPPTANVKAVSTHLHPQLFAPFSQPSAVTPSLPPPLPLQAVASSVVPSLPPTLPQNLPEQPSGGGVLPRAKADRPKKRGPKASFTPVQDLMILREVAANNAHIADHGKKVATFEKVRQALVATNTFDSATDAKRIADRYHRLQTAFDKSDLKLSKMSVVGGEVTEAEELFSSMREARDDPAKQKAADHDKRKAIEDRKLAAGRRIVEMSMKRRAIRDDSDDTSDSSEGHSSSDIDVLNPVEAKASGVKGEDNAKSGESAEGKKKRNKKKKKKIRGNKDHGGSLLGDLASFGQSIHASDDAQLAYDRDRLKLEQERFAFEREERQKDRQERREEFERERSIRREEREAQSKLELDKFKLMMDMFNNKVRGE